ncbi:MAG: carboxypeptidase-like regulatory domain-containing protein [Chloroflexota bacterium]
MDLYEYPRPSNDTGIGIHWSVGYAAAIGLARIRDVWLPELRSLGVKWVKIFNHDGAQDFSELLLAEGFMPILRLYRPHPNPGRLSIRELVTVDEFIRIGVRYFELNHEPDQDGQWQGGRVPANGLDIVVEDTIGDMEAVLERGGMPAIPAVSSGSRWDIIGRMIEAGRKDLLEGPVWQAIHNYSRNRPLDYPYDIGNQEGAPYTERFFYEIANDPLSFPAWHGRTLAQINQLRREYASHGATVSDDHACWLAYEFFNQRNLHHLGRSIPILSTENGYLIGENTDPRYPATTPDLHMAQTLEACRIMMGVSQRYQNAPDYYFCTAFTLIANMQLGSPSNWWEGQAWYSRQWRGGMLPVARALKLEPKVLRSPPPKPAIERISIMGTLLSLGGDGLINRRPPTIVLDQHGRELARIEVNHANQYRFPDLPPGVYTVRVDGTELVEAVTLHPGETERVLNLDLAVLNQDIGRSTLSGTVRGGADAVIMLVRADDGEEWVTMARADGTFRFVDLPPGIYNIRIHPSGSQEHGIILNGQDSHELTLAVWGWGYTVHQDAFKKNADQLLPITEYVLVDSDVEETYQDNPGQGNSSPDTLNQDTLSQDISNQEISSHDEISPHSSRAAVIRCSVEGHKNVRVRAEAGDWQSPVVETGSAPQYGEFACVLDLLSHRTATHNQTYLVVADGVVDERGVPIPLEATVMLQPDHRPTVRFIYQETHQTITPSRAQIRGRIYGLSFDQNANEDQGIGRDAVGGEELGAKEITVTLFDDRAQQQQQRVSLDGTYLFHDLPAGTYTVVVDGYESDAFVSDIALDGTNEVFTEMVLPREGLGESRENRQRSRIFGLFPLAAGRMAYLVDAMGNEQSQVIGSDEYVRFENLPAGSYTLRGDGGFSETALTVDGFNGLEVFFSTLVSRWTSEVNAAGSMPGFSAVRVEVRGRNQHTVYLIDQDQKQTQAITGSRPDLGEYSLEFSPLDPGRYVIQPSELDVQASVDLTGLEAVWVSFWEQKIPSNPNAVLPLDEQSHGSYLPSESNIESAEGHGYRDLEADKPQSPDAQQKKEEVKNSGQEVLLPERGILEQRLTEQENQQTSSIKWSRQDNRGRLEADANTIQLPDNAHFDHPTISQSSEEQLHHIHPHSKEGTTNLQSSQLESNMKQDVENTTQNEGYTPSNENDYLMDYDGAPSVGPRPPLDSSQNQPLSSLQRAAEEAEKAITEYLFIEDSSDADLKKTIDSLIAVLRYVAKNQPEIGSNLETARTAERVVVMGKVSQQILAELQAAGVEIEEASGNLVDAYRHIQG